METIKEKPYTVLLLCDRTDMACCENEIFCSAKYCSHTLDVRYAVHKDEYVGNPTKFLKERCKPVETERKIIFVEEENGKV